MTANWHSRHGATWVIGLDHCDGAVAPTRHVSLCSLRQIRDGIRIDEVFVTCSPEIDANETALTAQILDDAEAVAKIVGDEECVSIRTDRNATRINRSAIAVVAR